uniref:C3H1-type domain-containing protein n=1 Tax=Kalanchoe fedtschenkoi TaxID=63787 RepID=A0A7N0VJP9_KALFE
MERALKGEHCEFSHVWNDPENNVCTFYQRGACGIISTANSLLSDSGSLADPSRSGENGAAVGVPAWSQLPAQNDLYENEDFEELRILYPADRAMCSFTAAGRCPRGENCLMPREWGERSTWKLVRKKQKHLQALTKSQTSVCLDRVLSKANPAERKFGLLSECDHPFCILCIRNWRSSSPSSGMDVDSALRACPIFCMLSYFRIPSVIWSVDCRRFEFGNRSCPFGTSCFYKHAFRDGSLEEVSLRHLGAEDGITVSTRDIRLSDFLANLNMR